MKPWPVALVSLICFFVLSSCGKRSNGAAQLPAQPQVGATYLLNDGEGGFRAAKVLAVVEDEVVFVQLLGARWKKQPTLGEVHKVQSSTAVAYSPPSFTGMQPIHLENGTVSPEELEAYETWKTGKRDIF